jgi:hypothetical protein
MQFSLHSKPKRQTQIANISSSCDGEYEDDCLLEVWCGCLVEGDQSFRGAYCLSHKASD